MNVIIVIILIHMGSVYSAINYPYLSAPPGYYGSPAVWNGFCEDKEKYISMFRMPNCTVVIQGQSQYIGERLATGNFSGVWIHTIIHIIMQILLNNHCMLYKYSYNNINI